jgi:pyridoxamine 5'-phosphate oxidase
MGLSNKVGEMAERTGVLLECDVEREPLAQFRRWYADAEAAGIRVPQAMALATATSDGAPSVRMVLLKGLEDGEFAFYTGYVSRKADELAANPRGALLFYWDPVGRQVRVEGTVRRVSAGESDAYFATRPLGAQIAAAASKQSAVLSNRDELDARVAELEGRYAGDDVPRPEHWGGYRLAPAVYEFWQHREDRAHDRLRYRREGGDWILERLSP